MVAHWLRCCATNRKVAGSIPVGVSGFFIDIKSFRSHYGPGVDSACNRNEYQEYFLGIKGGWCIRLTTYHHPVLLSRNLGTLTSWKPLGLTRPVMGLLYLIRSCNVLILNKMWGTYSGVAEGWSLLHCDTMSFGKSSETFIHLFWSDCGEKMINARK